MRNKHQILRTDYRVQTIIMSIASLAIAIATLISCTNTDAKAFRTDEDDDTMYQVSTLQSLLNGGYDGSISVGELKRNGDIGVGTFDKIDGEMIVVDGIVYQARYDGSVNVADDELTTPFANVTHFDKDTTITLQGATSMDHLTTLLNEAIKETGLHQIYVARMDIESCDSILVRSELPQHPPYHPLAEVLQTDQREFTYSNIGGTIVALYFPDFFDKQNSTGWHLHFISTDKKKGGHIFNISTSSTITVHFDATPYYKLYIPETHK